MPQDTPTLPNSSDSMPNNLDESTRPVVTSAGQANVKDETQTLLPNSTKYEISSNQWLAVSLEKGIYNVKTREEGQVVYIAATPEAKASLRVTKNFDIETPSRVALYIKGQSLIDLVIKDLRLEIGQKADMTTVYTKEETTALINLLISQALAGLTNALMFKGSVDTLQVLLNMNAADLTIGDVYQVLDTGLFYAWIEKDNNFLWEQLSGTFVDLDQYYDKQEVNFLLQSKADLSSLLEYKNVVDSIKQTFDYEQIADPSQDNRPAPTRIATKAELEAMIDTAQVGIIYYVENEQKYYSLSISGQSEVRQFEEVSFEAWTDPTKEGQTWFNPSNGLIYLRKTSEETGELFWLNSLQNYLVLNQTKYVLLDTQQIITGKKLFEQLPEMTTDIIPTEDRHLVTKAYVDTKMASGPVDIARLSTMQTFTAQNTFHKAPIISTPEDVTNLDDDKLITKAQVTAITTALFDTNPTITTPKTFDALQDNEVITKGVLPTQTSPGLTDADLINLAKLDEENTFTNINTFDQAPIITADPTEGRQAVNVAYMQDYTSAEIVKIGQTYYTKAEITNLLDEYVRQDSIADFMQFKGSLADYSNLALLPNKQVGDVYYISAPKDKAGFWLYDSTSFISIGTGLSFNTENLAKLNSITSNVFNTSNTFNLTAETEDGQERQLTFNVGQMLNIANQNLLLNNEKITAGPGATKIKQRLEVLPDATTPCAVFETDTIDFLTNPSVNNVKAIDDLQDNGLITKKQCEELLTNSGGTGNNTGSNTGSNIDIDTTNLAKLNEENTFTQKNVFSIRPEVDINNNNKSFQHIIGSQLLEKDIIVELFRNEKTAINSSNIKKLQFKFYYNLYASYNAIGLSRLRFKSKDVGDIYAQNISGAVSGSAKFVFKNQDYPFTFAFSNSYYSSSYYPVTAFYSSGYGWLSGGNSYGNYLTLTMEFATTCPPVEYLTFIPRSLNGSPGLASDIEITYIDDEDNIIDVKKYGQFSFSNATEQNTELPSSIYVYGTGLFPKIFIQKEKPTVTNDMVGVLWVKLKDNYQVDDETAKFELLIFNGYNRWFKIDGLTLV